MLWVARRPARQHFVCFSSSRRPFGFDLHRSSGRSAGPRTSEQLQRPCDGRRHIVTRLLSPLECSLYPDNLQLSRGDLAGRFAVLSVAPSKSSWVRRLRHLPVTFAVSRPQAQDRRYNYSQADSRTLARRTRKIERAASGPFEITAESSFRFDGEAVCDPTLRQKKAKDGAHAFVEREGWATRPSSRLNS